MSARELRCFNCLLTNKGQHPYLCPTCRDALRAKGPNMTGTFSPRRAWWQRKA